MADENNIKKITQSKALEGLGQSSSPTANQSTDTNRNIVDQHEFLTLLVNQLQHQDPLNPMNNEEFAVQLAQFSQLEQLVDINKKLGEGGNLGGSGSVSSMASFLGHEVVLKDQFVQVAGGKGPNVLVDLPAGIQSARVDLVDENGQVSKSYTIDDLEPGRKMITLENIDVSNGSYEVRAVGVNGDGSFVTLDSKVTGTVEGFVVEPEPSLIVNGVQVALDEVIEVYLAPKRA